MAGNRNSGRRPSPPSDEDTISELLLDLQGQLVEMEAADRRHMRQQRNRRRMMLATITRVFEGWRRLRGLYPDPDPTPLAEVVPFTRDHLAAA